MASGNDIEPPRPDAGRNAAWRTGGATFQPGWCWSNDLRPLLGTDSCPVRHLGYVLSGRLHVQLDDGSTLDLEPGQVVEIPPGHDAWVIATWRR